LDSDTENVLQGLHRIYKLGIISNFAIPECVDKLLKIHGLDKLFDLVVVSAAVNKRKPSPEIFNSTMKALGVYSSETVFVGDTIDADIEGPHAVGVKTVYIQRRIEKEAECVHPDITIKSLSELPSVLEDL
jgi:putative hydrolase of the HAD superfamily